MSIRRLSSQTQTEMLLIDRVVFSDFPRREVAVIGWCAFDDATPAHDLWIDCAGWRTPCLAGLARPDVAQAHDAAALASSGFLARFPVERRTDRARLIAHRAGVETLLGDIPLNRLDTTAVQSWRPASRSWLPASQSWRPASAGPALGGHADYSSWLRAHERDQSLERLSATPTMSVILRVSGAHLYHLHRCVQSVVDQRYPHWELCLAADGPGDRRLHEYLTVRAHEDARIKLSAAATGDFVMHLDQKDELHPFALWEVASCVNAQPRLEVIYSDEDRIDQLGIRTLPAFKPEFDPDFFRAPNDLGRLVATRADRDHAPIHPDRIAHIAKPLYHRRLPALSSPSREHEHDRTDVARVTWNLPERVRIAVIYRASEGTYQRRALERTRTPLNSSLFPCEESGRAWPDSDITIVVNCAVDSINHHCVEELAAQALRDNVGIVGGVVVGTDKRVATAGLSCDSTGAFINPFAGLSVEDAGYLSQARSVHRVASIAPYLFAFRTGRLRDVPDHAVLRPDGFAALCQALVQAAHAAGLDVLHTPFAVVTLRAPAPPFEIPPAPSVPARCRINPNLEAFPDIPAIMRAGVPSRESLVPLVPLVTDGPVSTAADAIDTGPIRLRTLSPGLAAPFRRLLRAFG